MLGQTSRSEWEGTEFPIPSGSGAEVWSAGKGGLEAANGGRANRS